MELMLITDQAHAAIARAVAVGQKLGLELGGSLLAIESGGTTLVAYALPTGPNADQSWGRLGTDAAFQNSAIATVQASFPELVYVGDWHVHPMWLPELSGTDRATARTILQEEVDTRGHLTLLLGTAAPGKSPVVLGFKAAVKGHGLAVEHVRLRCVADDSPEVTSRLGRPLSPLDALLRGEEPEIAVLEHAEVAHVEADLDQVRTELHAEATMWLSGDTLGARIQRGRQEAVVLFPPEYPLGAPQVFSGSFEHGPLRPVPLRYGWSSLHRVVDVVSEALDSGDPEPASREAEPNSGTGHRALGWLRSAVDWALAMRSPRLLAQAAEHDARRRP